MDAHFDAIVVGAGPNGLAAAIELARNSLDVKVVEAEDTVGGGTRTAGLTRPGFSHDICSAVHPMAVSSPFIQSLPLEQYGLEWLYPSVPLAHPLPDEPAVLLHHSLHETAAELDKDAKNYQKLFEPFTARWEELAPQLLAPFSLFPSNPLLMARFGFHALKSARHLAFNQFNTDRARALFAGMAAHSIQPLEQAVTSAVGMVLGIAAHAVGWPIPKGGSHNITRAMASYFKSLGGTIQTSTPVESVDQLDKSTAILFDVTPRQVLDIAGAKLSAAYCKKLKKFRYGPGVFKIDWALEGPIPWTDDRCKQSGTIHIGGSFEEIASSERSMFYGQHHEKPYVLLAQPSVTDQTRAPEEKQAVWAYCHVPHGSTKDMTEIIERQVERFAPGFKDLILDRHAMNTAEMQRYNPNYIGGDINGGIQDLGQLFTRPVGLIDPYHIPDTSYYICSSSTPPGGGVHGMCGYHAARSVLKREFS